MSNKPILVYTNVVVVHIFDASWEAPAETISVDPDRILIIKYKINFYSFIFFSWLFAIMSIYTCIKPVPTCKYHKKKISIEIIEMKKKSNLIISTELVPAQSIKVPKTVRAYFNRDL